MKKLFLTTTTLLSILLYGQNIEVVDTLQLTGSGIEATCMAPDGNTLITGDFDGYISIWDLKKMSFVKSVKIHSGSINTILFDKSQKKFLTAGEDGKVAICTYPDYKIEKIYYVTPTSNTFASFSEDGKSIYYGGDNSKRKYDYNTYKYDKPYAPLYKMDVKDGLEKIVYNDEVNGGAGNKITDGNTDYSWKYIFILKKASVVMYNIKDQKVERIISLPYSANNFTSTSEYLYVWGDRMLMKLKKSENTYQLVKTVVAGSRDSYSGYSKIAVSEDQQFLATGDYFNDVTIWNAGDLSKKQVLKAHTNIVRNINFWNKDSIVITSGYDGKILVWGIPKPKVEEVVEVVKDVVFSENNIPVSIKDRTVEKQSTLKVKTTEFEIAIRDMGAVDGDIISLNLNGEWILNEYTVTKTAYKIKVKLNPNFTNNFLILYAHNLGEISPNTAQVSLVIDGKKINLSLKSDLEKSGAINFEYVK